MTSEYDKDPLLYNLKRDTKIRELRKQKYQYYRSIGRPSIYSLDENESTTLRKILNRYDRQYNVYKSDFSNMETVEKLEGLGFIRIEQDGRIVPSFVYQEHGKPVFKKRETVNVGNKEFKI